MDGNIIKINGKLLRIEEREEDEDDASVCSHCYFSNQPCYDIEEIPDCTGIIFKELDLYEEMFLENKEVDKDVDL